MTTLTAPAPIIVNAMETAGEMAQRVARNMQRGYHADRYELACNLTDALGYDAFGKWRIDDQQISRDRNHTTEARRGANERRAWRTELSDRIARLDDAAFDRLITTLANGDGPEEATRWRDAANITLRAFTEAMKQITADAADGYDVAS